ncbi:bifunctional preprotein translocase subunit SecD/SecF [Chryseobacterium gleum]|jgi:SecD/SecF fusion protein|uniref:Multifunctional fusion protein n=2 Tax=Chryseobacterium gleum TaxID=250 RepID=A0A448AW68_CHRGE|nr:protein translocase subunit SecD [Chryseobacterium gleum]EFK35349.1 export membrane protein SecD [Chryseobacterium gleum ATCC 35910]MCD9619096.1 protein translocase subunit SecD [Chryseobacterium gleum]MCE4063706.1 protein translocase subunit SecD [Chryseobacterium gleum]QBJ84795.1 protein translocase subunit SecD [Chryseobacterium gleum]QQY31127.1 protein translocase subunit SecD [Chryseobacterium gleum]
MQGKGLITIVAIVLGLICLNELLPTWYASKIEKQATAIAGDNPEKYQKEIARLSKDTLNLGFTKLYYTKAKDKEMKLGLDLKGGINVLLEINQRDLVNDLTNYSTNPVLIEALNKTDEAQKNSTKPYIDNFFEQFDVVNKAKGANLKLADPEIFGNTTLTEVKYNTPDEQVKSIVKRKIDASVGTAFEVIRTRIDKLGAIQPNVQRVPGTARISVEMPGMKDIDKVKKMLQTSAKLQFWEVQQVPEIAPYFQTLTTMVAAKGDSMGVAKNVNFMNLLQLDKLRTNGVANVKLSDTAVVNKILNSKVAQSLRPANIKYTQFMWGYKPEATDTESLVLYAIRGNINQKAPVDGAVETASIGYDELSRIVVDMQMDSKGAKEWKTLTEKNVGKPVAVTLDNRVYTAPNVVGAIPNGRTQISGNFSQEEAKELVDVLGAGKLPAGAKVVQATVVGPSLGQEAIDSGLMSFIIAFAIIIVYIIFYYGGAGVYAVIAMVINLFYIFGIMDSGDFTLTLPGIAGIVLTMAVAVDTNVIIYERTKEELFAGKSILEAYKDGFKHALNAIIDGHTTTFLTAVVLFFFGTGPIKGFALTLMIGIAMTLFTSVLLSRVMIFSRLNKGKGLSVWTPATKNLFRNTWIDFIGKRKYAYIISAVLTIVCIISIATHGFKYGIDFTGGRNYVVRFDKDVKAEDVEEKLVALFKTEDGKNSSVEAKTFGNNKQLKISTDYLIQDESLKADQIIEQKLFEGLKSQLPAGTTLKDFKSADKDHAGIISSEKVGPSVADDIQTHGIYAVLAALAMIFIYILVRFRKWQFSLGAVAALFHDAVIILGAYSLLHKYMPFNMEINQDFIAAILTVLGYSINDTVIIFDRIREYLREKKSLTLAGLFDDSISSTLGRTFNTSFTTILVILAIFIFGGDNLRGFMFAMLIGIGFGTYSSIFVASAIAYDFLKTGKEEEVHGKSTSAKEELVSK